MRRSLEQSCDVYFYETARRVGIDRIAEMANRLGLGRELDLPVTAMRAGLIPTQGWKRATKNEGWQVGDTLNSGIGQGFVLATPLQLAVMTARIASGTGVQPRLIRARAGQPAPPLPAADLGIDPAHVALVRQGMDDVVNGDRGTARGSRIEDAGYRMAGKTGTSQVRNITAAERARGVFRNEDLPWERRDHALFVGFAPAEAPRFAVSVVVEHGGGGSKAAAPIARDILLAARDLVLPRGEQPAGQGANAPAGTPADPKVERA
jgi:penicillin-binding protein 2